MTTNARTLTGAEIVALVDAMNEPERLLAALVYLTGRRVAECARLRVRDVGPGCIYRHDKHGMLRGIDMLPPGIEVPLGEHLEGCVVRFERDRALGVVVDVPDGLYEGNDPAESWRWRYLFLGPLQREPGGRAVRMPHSPERFRKAFAHALSTIGLARAFTPQALIEAHRRHAVARAIDDLSGSRPIAAGEQVVSLAERRARDDCGRTLEMLCGVLAAPAGANGRRRR